MFPPSAALSLLLALAGPAPETWLDHEAACGRLEDQAKAAGSADRGASYLAAADECGRAFEKVPAGPRAMDQRSHFVTEAHRLYEQAHDAGVQAALCSDIRTLDAFAALLAALPEGARAEDRTDVARMREESIAQTTASCGPEPGALEPVGASVAPSTVVAPPPAVPSGPADPPPSRQAPRHLRLAGGAALGVGLGLGVGVIAALVRGAALQEQVASMKHEGQLIPEADAELFADLDARGHRADNAAIGLGVAGGLLTVAGVALLIVDARRHAAPRRAAVHPSVLPTAGIHFSLRF